MKIKLVLLAAASPWVLCGTAFAQDQNETGAVLIDEAAQQRAEIQTDDRDVIVVTARRREEALQDTPISVSVLSGDQLAQSGVNDVQDLQFRTPGLSITSAQSQRNTVAFSMRGQRVQETQLFTDPPVGTYFAEVVQPRPYGFGKTFFDIGSVQVLKGVQGTLFGRNMTGGAVLVEPQHPELGEFSGEIRGQYGNYDMWDLTGAVNVPVGDSVAIRLAGRTHERNGFARDVTSGLRLDNENYDALRGSLLIAPGDRFESLTIVDWYESDETGTASFMTDLAQPSVVSIYEQLRGFGLIDTNIPAQFAAAQQLFRQNRFALDIGAGEGGNLDVQGSPFERIETWGITNKTTFDLTDNLTLKNIFGYRKQERQIVQDYDGIPAFLITPFQFSETENISEELQLQGSAFEDRLDFIVGGYFFEESGTDGSIASTLPELNIIGAGLDPRTTDASLFFQTNPGEGYARTLAGFVAGTFEITPQLSVSGGLRYNYDKRKITVSPSQPNLPGGGRCSFDIDATTPGLQTVPLDECEFSNSASFKEWTYDATIQYEPSADLTVYASYRHGFRAGGFSTRATNFITLSPFLPEFVDEYEIGLKTNHRIGNASLTTSTAIYQQDLSDVQKQRASAVDTDGDGTPDNIFTIVDNTAAQRHRGGEFEFNLAVDAFTLSGFYSYVDVDIQEGRVISAGGIPEFENRGTPKHQLGLTGVMSPPIDPSVGKLDFIVNYSWRSATFLDDFEFSSEQKAFSLVNARIELDEIAGTGLSAALFVNNALDETYRIGVLGLITEGLGFSSSVYGEPRTYGVELGYRF